MGEIKRRNRGHMHQDGAHGRAEDMMFYERIIRHEVKRALRGSATQERKQHPVP